jgi:hypothetical protein
VHTPPTTRAAIHIRGGADFALYNGVVQSTGWCLDVDQAQTVQTAGPDEAGPPIIRNTAFSCGQGFADTDADTFESTAYSHSGSGNNESSFTTSLANVFVNGPNEAGFTPYNMSPTLNAISGGYYTNATYVGAVRDANDTWYRGWTCDSGYANFGSNQNCNVVPA